MNGLEIIDEKDPSLTDKLLRREPRENAYIEIHNTIARAPINQIGKDDIDAILAEHKSSAAAAKSRLTSIYADVLKHYIKDFRLSDEETEQLGHLRDILSLDPADTGHIHAAVIYPIFQNAVRNAVFDDKLTGEEETWLNEIARGLKIPEEFVPQLYASVVQPYIQWRLNSAVSDGKLSPDEERELAEISKNLKATVGFSEATHAVLERARYLWRLESGELPRANTGLYLKRNEFCSVFVPVTHHEMRTVTTGVKYSGYSQSSDTIFGTRYRSGSIRTQRITENVLEQLDSGTLYFTNMRLLFDGSQRSTEFPLRNIIGATFYSDGMLVERDSGKDQTFLITGDVEALQLIFDTLMTNYRK
jgi:hypothetical protein